MKLSLPILATLAFCMTFCAQGFAQLRDPGVYAPTSSGPMRLSQLPMPAQRTTSWASMVFGDDRLSLRYTWAGANSFTTVSEHRPTLRVNLGYLPDRGLNAIQIVKLEQKGDYRKSALRWRQDVPAEFQGGVAVGVSRGIDGELLVQPSADLAPGEYMLSLGALGAQYDFSVR
jgi:hypothetical protein